MKYEVNIPAGVSGDYKIVEGLDTILQQNINGEWLTIMADSELEANQAKEFLDAATGDVLLAGLGIGMVLQPLIDNDNVTSITIVEKFQEVIDLVWTHTPSSSKITLVNDDIYTWTPDKNYDVAWFDSFINPIDGLDNLGEYKTQMQDKYENIVGSGFFWPSHQGW